MSKIYAVLDEADFRKLIAGQEVVKPGSDCEVHLILADIGWTNMIIALSDAMREAQVYPQLGAA